MVPSIRGADCITTFRALMKVADLSDGRRRTSRRVRMQSLPNLVLVRADAFNTPTGENLH